jgi:hypothetical protein
MKKITIIVLMLFTALSYAQVGINTNTPDASSALEIESTTGGILIPRLTETQRDAISAPATGLMIYQTDGIAGFYFWNGSAWTKIDGVAGPQGPAGADGADGAQGPVGPQGIQGIQGADATSPTYSIGDIVNGGVVFWLDSTGQHGLVAAFSDVSTDEVQWGCYGTDLLNVPNVSIGTGSPVGSGAEIGDGFNNTNNILKDCPTAPAALAARSYGPDWFLPSAKELNEMYDNKTTLEDVSGFNAFDYWYWSSTELDNNQAWSQLLAGGTQGRYNKNFIFRVRAVRAF